MMEQGARQPPHVVIFPFPALGHVHPMLNLAELLSLSGIHVTFINALSIHNRLLRCTDLQSRFGRFPGFRFKTINYNLGLGDGLPHTCDDIMAVLSSLRTTAKPLLEELFLLDNCQLGDVIGQVPPVTCLISDGILIIALEVADDCGIPTFHFRTSSASSFWAYYCIPQLIHAGELPFSGNDLDTPIASVKGMESFLRRRDLPSFCRVDNLGEGAFQYVMKATLSTATRTKGLIFNTFEELEGPILDQIRVDIPNVYTIGPLHAHLKNQLASESKGKSISSHGLWEEDRSCLQWLDEQPSRSVLYVSFGSLITLTKHELTEFWHGLVNSDQQFLWVIRHDVIKDKDDVLEVKLKEGWKENGYIVSWAPQEEVLAHPSIGGFLTHSGWNSTLESIYEAVPMICWPQLADQQVNSRFVGEVWKLGLDLKDTCDRVLVENMVRDLMEARRNEFLQRANEMAKFARTSVSEGGSSTRNLDRLIQDIYIYSFQGGKSQDLT